MQPALRQPASARSLRLYVVGAVLVTALGLGLRAQALSAGFFADDFAQLGMLEGHYLVPRSPFDLFNFSDGTLSESRQLEHGGFYPWWSEPRLRISMLRPLASALMWLDWKMFAHDAFAYHLHSLLWWLAMLAAIGVLFQRLLSPPVAFAAYTLLVLDEAQGAQLAWVANRCALSATALSVAALLVHLRQRERDAEPRGFAVLGLFTLALGFGEYAVCAAGYFLAYELLQARGALRTRLLALWPVAVPVAGYLLLRALLHHGPRFSGMYVDPLNEPHAFFAALLQRVPVMFADLALGARADWWTFGLPWVYALIERGRVPLHWALGPEPWREIDFVLGLGALGLVAAWRALTPRNADTRNTRWLFVGSVLALLPAIASFPSSRLLLVSLIGFTPLLASFVVSAFQRLRERVTTAPMLSIMLLMAATGTGLYQLVVPAWLTHLEARSLALVAQATRRAVVSLPVDEQRFPQQRVVVLAALESGTSLYLPLLRWHEGRSVPARCWTLSLAPCPHLLHRESPNALTLTPVGDFVMLATAVEQMYRTPERPLKAGDTIDLGGAKITVLSLLRGKPKTIRATFDVPLEDASLRFVLSTPQGIQPFAIPGVGHTVLLPHAGIPL